MIVDIDYLENTIMNDDLYNLCISTNPEDTKKVERLISLVENKIKLYIDIEQFKNENGEYSFPEDLKECVRFLIESLFLQIESKHFAINGIVKKESKKLDDFSYSIETEKSGSYKSLLFYDIPILKDYQDILDKYRGNNKVSLTGRISV